MRDLSVPDIFTLRQVVVESGVGNMRDAQDMSLDDLEQIWEMASDLHRRRAMMRASLGR